jgi:hypothetical protein
VRLFTCESCKGVLFFENSRCMTCNHPIGYCPEAAKLVPLPEAAPAPDAPVTVEVSLPGGTREKFLQCKNFAEHGICNWLVRAADNEPYCLSCRLTEVIPDLTDVKNRQAWAEVESAKRRLVYTLRALQLPVLSKGENAEAGLSFRFLRGTKEAPVTTGHAEGLITLNVAEADAAYRENMREKLGEAYRTVLGHLRHEIGHYYWDRLVRDGGHIAPCRALFGDESASYEAAIQRHYGEGPPPNWAETFISAYATMHPWEDWAETWAHYLHMLDTLETAKSHGLTVRIPGQSNASAKVSTDQLKFGDFEGLMSGWQAVTVALNSLSRSMGMKDVYPFVLSQPVRDKLRFVHDLIQEFAGKGMPLPPPKAVGSDPVAPNPVVTDLIPSDTGAIDPVVTDPFVPESPLAGRPADRVAPAASEPARQAQPTPAA